MNIKRKRRTMVLFCVWEVYALIEIKQMRSGEVPMRWKLTDS